MLAQLSLNSSLKKAHWAGQLATYNIEMQWKAGKTYTKADALSCITTEDIQNALLRQSPEEKHINAILSLNIDQDLLKEIAEKQEKDAEYMDFLKSNDPNNDLSYDEE